MYEMAEVCVNGKVVGSIWTNPSRLDITDYLASGDNDVEITVATNWHNRIIGDLRNQSQEPQAKYTYRTLSPDEDLQLAGLLREPVLIKQKH